LFNISAII